MQYQQARKWIEEMPRFSHTLSLERIRSLWDRLGRPQEKLPVVHVAGTNGKGSTCAMIADILQAAGYRTGLFMSPAVLDFRERIQINGEKIPEQVLADWTEKMIPLAAGVGDVNASEFLTAMAFGWFADQRCDLSVIEVGLGGRWDATNGIAACEVSVITAIGLDHTAILGNTLTKIAEEKCGIIKPGCPVVTCPEQAEEALTVIKNNIMDKNSELVQIEINRIQIEEMNLEGSKFFLDGQEYQAGMIGRHQVKNACTAISACHVLRRKGWERVTEEAIRKGLAQARLPARMEILRREPLILLDGAHNPQSAKALRESLKLLPAGMPLLGVIGMMADKDSRQFLEIMAPCFHHILCFSPYNSRALPVADLVWRAEKEGLSAKQADSMEQAWRESEDWAKREKGAVLWCGSFYLASELHTYLKKREP